MGYRGNLPSTHPDHALKRIENEMALNLVVMDCFSENYLSFNRDMFTTVFIGNSNTMELNGRMVTPRGYKDV